MNRPAALPLLAPAALAAVLFASACSLLLHFDPEGQPCDEDGQCLPQYVCREGKCLRRGADECGGCATGQRCLPESKTCVDNTCENKKCWAGSQCVMGTGNTPSCQLVATGNLGQLCSDDFSCAVADGGGSRVCLRGAIQLVQNGGMLRPGICVERCGADAGCQTPGAACTHYGMGLTDAGVNLCVPRNLLNGCSSDAPCADDELVCTVFDHPAVGALTLCDQPLPGGGGPGAPCELVSNDAGQLCANGLCIPRVPAAGQAQTCGQICSPGTCDGGRCELVEFGVQGLIRHVPMCVRDVTRCDACGAGTTTVCGPDAPRCSAGLSGARCLAACSPDAGGFPTCPPSQSCALLDAGYRCVNAPSLSCN